MDPIQFGSGKQGTEIPITARIVSIADVYDSLISERAYKGKWEVSDVLRYIESQAEKQFDPELAELFVRMSDVAHAITKKYSY